MSGDQLDLDAVSARAADAALTYSERWSQRVLREDVPALVAEVRRLRDWQRKVSDACGLTEIHMGYTPWVPDATPALLAMIEDTFTRSLHHAECERIEWERAVARGEVEPG